MKTPLLFVLLILLIVCFVTYDKKAFAQEITASNSISLSWTAPTDYDNNGDSAGPASFYRIAYSTNPIDSVSADFATHIYDSSLVPNTPGDTDQYVVIGLEPNTTYYFSVQAADATYFMPNSPPNPPVNWSKWSNVVAKSTEELRLSGGPYEFFVWNFNGDRFIDLGLRDLSSGNFYAAIRDTNSNRYIWNSEPIIEGWGESTDQLLIEDFSGDGYDDLCLYVAATGTWKVALNQYNSTQSLVYDGIWLTGWARGGIGGAGDWMPMAADFSGDGHADLCVYKPSLGRWVVAYNWGTYFAQATGVWLDGWGVGDYRTYLPFVGTLDAGSKLDVGCYHPGTGRWFPAVSNSPDPHFIKKGLWLDNWATWISEYEYIHFCGLFIPKSLNVDDLLVGELSLGRWYAAENTGTSFIRKVGLYAGKSLLDNWPASVNRETYQYEVGDVSGDGYYDLLSYDPSNGNVEVAYNYSSNNPAFFSPISGSGVGNFWIRNWGIDTSSSVAKIAASNTISEDFETLDAESSHAIVDQNYPNPFNPTTTISYSIDEATHVTLEILNVLGQRVETLVDEDQSIGDHFVNWDASRYASGVYFYRFTAGNVTKTKKMILIR